MSHSPYDYFRVSLLPGIGPRRGRSLLAAFGSFDELRRAYRTDLLRVDGFSARMAHNIITALREESRSGDIERQTEKNAEMAARKGFTFLSWASSAYPDRLRSIYDPPLYLFMRGALQPEDTEGVAVVGTRNPSDYGRRCTEDFCRHFAGAGITVVSGLAMGIDTVAHRCALRFGGRTVAVLGSGLLRVYPGTNRPLAESVSGHGAVLSELPLDAKPDAQNFPRRNRIISGLSRALVVMESAVTGGAMITASIALDQNREVFAVPGNVHNAMSAGPHRLIQRSMAQIATCAAAVLEELSLDVPADTRPVPAVQLTLSEQHIMDALSDEALHVDELSVRTGLALPALLTELLQMEFRGVVRQLPGKYFCRETFHRK
ncbi:MAG: DNA-processing protein DprA [Bacteroidota bacterium]|nr:DNA-processing protein DprA [Bacteroidota bacterium]